VKEALLTRCCLPASIYRVFSSVDRVSRGDSCVLPIQKKKSSRSFSSFSSVLHKMIDKDYFTLVGDPDHAEDAEEQVEAQDSDEERENVQARLAVRTSKNLRRIKKEDGEDDDVFLKRVIRVEMVERGEIRKMFEGGAREERHVRLIASWCGCVRRVFLE